MAATRYVRSTDGSNADDGSTWALAKLDLVGVSAIDTAGDTIFVSQVHAESTAGAITFAGAGTNASPTKLICGNDAAEPPTAVATTATVSTTGTNNITINGSLYAYGISFISGSGLKIATATADVQIYDSCVMQYTGSTTQFGPSNVANVAGLVRLVNTNLKQLSTTSQILVSGRVEIEGGAIVSGSSASASALFTLSSDRTHCSLSVSGFDFTNAAAGTNLVSTSGSAVAAVVVIRNCKLPTSWSGVLVTGTILVGQRYEMYNCDSAGTNYRIWVEDYSGSTKSETTVVRTNGANDGTTALSWKMVTSANAIFPTERLVSPEIVIWNDTTGSSKTVTVEFVHDTNVAGGQGAGASFAFQNDEVWLEVEYLGTSGFPLSTLITSCKADVLAAAADDTSSSVAWTTTGLTTPVKQKLAVTFTPQTKGFIHARIVMAKASKTIYVDPMLTVA